MQVRGLYFVLMLTLILTGKVTSVLHTCFPTVDENFHNLFL